MFSQVSVCPQGGYPWSLVPGLFLGKAVYLVRPVARGGTTNQPCSQWGTLGQDGGLTLDRTGDTTPTGRVGTPPSPLVG